MDNIKNAYILFDGFYNMKVTVYIYIKLLLT